MCDNNNMTSKQQQKENTMDIMDLHKVLMALATGKVSAQIANKPEWEKEIDDVIKFVQEKQKKVINS
tara:strand:- start:60 stop:260 length:201 start_codon:yes stop_codon:yes gene_type:complete